MFADVVDGRWTAVCPVTRDGWTMFFPVVAVGQTIVFPVTMVVGQTRFCSAMLCPAVMVIRWIM
jgi:hypothetical protein